MNFSSPSLVTRCCVFVLFDRKRVYWHEMAVSALYGPLFFDNWALTNQPSNLNVAGRPYKIWNRCTQSRESYSLSDRYGRKIQLPGKYEVLLCPWNVQLTSDFCFWNAQSSPINMLKFSAAKSNSAAWDGIHSFSSSVFLVNLFSLLCPKRIAK